MTLYIVATPIGHPRDITLRALDILKATPMIICESTKETSRFLRQHDITGKTYELLNEHSTPDDVVALAQKLATTDAALVSDCGTPVFCDPGTHLIRECRKQNIRIETLPGASSLMGLISLSSKKLDQFLFRGFLSANTEEREQEWKSLQNEKLPIVIMDTPYRLHKTLDDIEKHFPSAQILIALNLTQSDELILEGTVKSVRGKIEVKKAEFILVKY